MLDQDKEHCQKNLDLVDELLLYVLNMLRSGQSLDSSDLSNLIYRARDHVQEVQKQFSEIEDWSHLADLTPEDILDQAEDTDFDFITRQDVVFYGDLYNLSQHTWEYLSPVWSEALEGEFPEFWYELMREKLQDQSQIEIHNYIYYRNLARYLETLGFVWSSEDDLESCQRLVTQIPCPSKLVPQELWREKSGDLIFRSWKILRYEDFLIWKIEHNVFDNEIFRGFEQEEYIRYGTYLTPH